MTKYPRQPWMTDVQYDRYCTFSILGDLYYRALDSKDRAAFLLIARVMKRLDAN